MSRRRRIGLDAAVVEELEDHAIAPCAEERSRLPFLDRVRAPVEVVIGFCLFATQTTTSGVALYHIPKNLAVEVEVELDLAGVKNPSSKIWAGEDRTWPSERVWPGDSVARAAAGEKSKMAKMERAAQRIWTDCSISIHLRENYDLFFRLFCMSCK